MNGSSIYDYLIDYAKLLLGTSRLPLLLRLAQLTLKDGCLALYARHPR